MKLEISNYTQTPFEETILYNLCTIGLNFKITKTLWCNYITIYRR